MNALVSLFWGAVAGIGWGILGYAREKQKDERIEFKTKHFVKTIITGAVIGIAAWYTGAPIESIAATPVADKIVNIINDLFE